MTLGLGSAKAPLLSSAARPPTAPLYAKDASKPLVMTLDATLARRASRRARTTTASKDLFAFRAYDANRLEITRGGQTVAFDKIKGAKPERRRQVAAGRRQAARSRSMPTKRR